MIVRDVTSKSHAALVIFSKSSSILSLRHLRWLMALFLAAAQSFAFSQQPVEVALAGFAFSGAASTIDSRFPYSRRYEAAQRTAGKPIYQLLRKQLETNPPLNFKIVGQLDELKGRSQALAVTLVVGSETISDEQFGNLHKLMVLIRGQTTFFDFKSMNVVRSYPISFAYIDLFDHPPSPEEIMTRVKLVYEGTNDKPGILARFSASVAKAQIPTQVSRYLQITNINVTPEAQAVIPSYLKTEPGTVDTWAADIVGEAISTRVGVPIIPFAKGYAIGNIMSLRVSDGAVWELKLPKPDYEISVEIKGFKKIPYSEMEGGAASFVYGAYGSIRIAEPLSNKVYLDTPLKNGETRLIPASQKYVDDFPNFYDALNGMFVKLALVIDGKGDEKWLKSATPSKGIEQQISQTRELMKLCK